MTATGQGLATLAGTGDYTLTQDTEKKDITRQNRWFHKPEKDEKDADKLPKTPILLTFGLPEPEKR